MVHLFIYEDILQYKAKIKKVINDINITNYEIIDEPYELNLNENNTNIFIIDLEKENSLEFLEKVNEKYIANLYIIVLVNDESIIYYLYKKRFFIFDILYKFDDFQYKLKRDINLILNRVNKNNTTIINKNINIPSEEIKQITILKNKIIIEAVNLQNENYSYIINGNFNNIKEDIQKYIVLSNNEYNLYFKEDKFNLNINLNITKKNNYAKPYNKEKKKEIISLYNKGYKVSEISKKHSISKTTIYNWINISKINSKIKKFDEIKKIVNK